MRFNIPFINFLSNLSILAFLLNVPFIFWYLFGSFYVLVSSVVIIILFILTLHYYKINEIKLDKYDKLWLGSWSLFTISFFVYSSIMMILYGDLFEFRKFIGLFTKYLFLVSTVIIVKTNFWYYLKQNFRINNIILLLSILLFFLLAFGINFPSFVFSKIDLRPHTVYWIGASNINYSWGKNILIRIAGFADEPGSFALIISYFIVINEITYKSAKLRLVLLLGGLFTFSLAFIITSIVFSIYWLRSGYVKIKSIFLIFALVSIVILIGNLKEFKPIVKMVSIFSERFEKGSDGRFKGDNRSISFPVQLNAFMEYPILGIGIDPIDMKKIEAGNPSFFLYLAMHGLWGAIFYFLPFYLLILLNIRKKELLLLIALFINYLQRPGIEDTFSMMALTIIFYAFVKGYKPFSVPIIKDS